MAKKKQPILYDKPFADEANKGFRHLVDHCLEQYQLSKDSKYRSKKLQEIADAVKTYAQHNQPTSEPWEKASNITMPLTTISCDNLEPRMVAGLIGKYPYVRFEMPLDQEKDEVTELLQEWFNQELQDTVGVERMARAITHRILQDGTVYVLPYYDIDEEIRTDFVFEQDIEQIVKKDPERGQAIAMMVQSGRFVFENGLLMDLETAEPVTQDNTEPIFEGGRYRLIPFNDVFVADDVDEWEKATVIRKVYPTYAELVRDAKTKEGYTNIGPWLYEEASDETLSKDRVSKSQAYDGVMEHGKATIECIECTLSYIHVEDDAEEKDNTNLVDEKILVQIAIDSKILIRAIPLRKIYHKNQHLVKRLRMFPEEGKSYGTGLATKLKAIQDGASKTFNMAINIAEITMIPWFLFEEKTGLKGRYKDGISLKIGQGLPVDSVQGIYFPKFGINPDQMFNWINLWVSFWERVSSIGDLQIGRQGEKDRTATETMAVIQEGNIKHNYQSTSIRDDFLEVITCLYDLYYQHMPFNKSFLWKGQEVPVPRQEMRRMKKFRLTGSTEQSNKLIERQEKEVFYQMTGADPNINPIKRAEELVKAYGHNDTAEWVSPQIAQLVQAITQTPGAPEMVGQLIMEMQANMQAQQQAQQGQQQ